jgi:hypothetical protein
VAYTKKQEPIYEASVHGVPRRAVIIVGSNGFIVTAFPQS